MIYYILMMMIKKETAKAYQLETEDGKLFWIQKRWMREDGTLTAAGEKAKAQAKTPVQGIKLATGHVSIPEEIKELARYENLILCEDEAKRSGKWIMIRLMTQSGSILRSQAVDIKEGIKEITGKAAFIRAEEIDRFAVAGWLAE